MLDPVLSVLTVSGAGHGLRTPFTLRIAVLLRGAASIASVVMACTDPRNRPAARRAHFIAIILQSILKLDEQHETEKRRVETTRSHRIAS